MTSGPVFFSPRQRYGARRIRKTNRAPFRTSLLLALLTMGALPIPLAAQTGTLRGSVRAAGSLEPIPFASIQLADPQRGVSANERGFFVIPDVPAGTRTLRATVLGYISAELTVTVTEGTTPVEFLLQPRALEVAGIEVRAVGQEGVTAGAAGPGPITLDPSVVDIIPALAESDVLRTLQMLPSVRAVSDFSSALYVRGGSPDQNLMLLDGAPLFNPFHLGGIFGSVDPEAISAVNMLPGAIPARVGDRVSSVVEIRTREGGRDRLRGNGSVGLISSRLSFDGPLPGEQGSYLLSLRRTYLDLITNAAEAAGWIEGSLPYSFSDANLKLTHDIGAEGRLSLAVHYDAEDVDIPDDLEFDGDADFDFGTRSASLNYWLPVGNVTTELRAAISSFRGDFFAAEAEPQFDPQGNFLGNTLDPVLSARTTIRNALLAGDLNWYRGRHQIRSGLQLDGYLFDYDIDIEDSDLSTLVPNFALRQRPTTLAGYLEDEIELGSRSQVRLGVRMLSAGERGTALMPRLGMNYALTPRITLSLGGGEYAQVLHSLRDEESLAASLVAYDLLAAVPEEIGMVRSRDIVLGGTWAAAGTSVRLDLFGKKMRDLPIAPSPDELLEAPVIVTEGFAAGEGNAYGLELLGRHRRGNLELSLAYSYLRAERRLHDDSYAPRFERQHAIDALAALPWGEQGSFSARFIFGSGQPYTPALGVAQPYVFDPARGVFVYPSGFSSEPTILLGEHNSGRLPSYLRLDVGARRPFVRNWFGRRTTVTPYLQILNVLNTRNVLFGEPTALGFDRPMLEYAPQLPILPTFGLEWKF